MFNKREKKMKCTDVSRLLSPYQDHELDDNLRETIGEHLAFCSECRKEMEELDMITMDVAGIRDVEPGHNFTAEVMSAVKVYKEKSYSGKLAYIYSLVFTLFFILGIIVGPYSSGSSQKSGARQELALVLLDGQRFSSADKPSSVIMQLSGGKDEKRDH